MTYPTLNHLLESTPSLDDRIDRVMLEFGELFDLEGKTLNDEGTIVVDAGHAGGMCTINTWEEPNSAAIEVYVHVPQESCDAYSEDVDRNDPHHYKRLMKSSLELAARNSGLTVTESDFENGITFQAKWTNKKAPETPRPQVMAARYNPEQAYIDRMTPSARAAWGRRQGHEHVGGHDANYKKGW